MNTRTMLRVVRRPAAADEAPPRPARARPVGALARRAGSTERIVASVTEAVIERRLMPGTKLSEQEMADIFAVSRTVVRQALNQLSRDRLVTLEPGRGAFVSVPSVEEARQVFELRTIVETAAMRRLCESITDRQIARLRQHLDAEAAAVRGDDVGSRTRLLSDFHVVLARELGNDVITELVSDLLSRSSLISLMYQSSHSAAQSHEQHVGIVDALQARDARQAARLMERHIDCIENDLHLAPGTGDLAAALRTPRR